MHNLFRMKHLIKIALVLLAGVAAYYVYGFTRLVADEWVAIGAAGSLVGTYIGLAFADIPLSQRSRARVVAQGAMAIEAIYGTLYVFQRQSPEVFASPLDVRLSFALAVLHGAAFSILAYFVSIFIVHEQTIEHQSSPADQRDRAIIDALGILVDRLEMQVSASMPLLADNAVAMETKAEAIRRLAQQQVEQGIDIAGIDTATIAQVTGYELPYVQQVVSRWRSRQR